MIITPQYVTVSVSPPPVLSGSLAIETGRIHDEGLRTVLGLHINACAKAYICRFGHNAHALPDRTKGVESLRAVGLQDTLSKCPQVC